MVLKVYILRQEGVEDEGVPGQPGKGGPAGGQVSRVDTTVPKLGESVKGRGGGVQEPGGEGSHALLVSLARDLEGVQGIEGWLEVELVVVGGNHALVSPNLGQGGSQWLGGMAGRAGLACRPCPSCPGCSRSGGEEGGPESLVPAAEGAEVQPLGRR